MLAQKCPDIWVSWLNTPLSKSREPRNLTITNFLLLSTSLKLQREKKQGKIQTVLQVKQVWGAHLSEECAIKLNNIRAVTASHHYIKVHQKLLLLLFIHC